MALPTGSLCYLVALLIAAVMFFYGLSEVLRNPAGADHLTGTSEISRQIRGFGWILASSVVLALGSGLCYTVTGLSAPNFGRGVFGAASNYLRPQGTMA